MGFCEYCGTYLRDGEGCNCDRAKQARLDLYGGNNKFCVYCGKPLSPGECCNCDGDKASRYTSSAPAQLYSSNMPPEPFSTPMPPTPRLSSMPTEPFPSPMPPARPKAPAAPSAAQPIDYINKGGVLAKDTANELADAAKSFVKDPISYAGDGKLSFAASVILLVVQAITFGIMVSASISKMLSPLFSMASAFGMSKSYGGSLVKLFFESSFIVIINIAIMFACLYVISLLMKKKLDIRNTLSSLAVSSVTLSAAFLLIAVLGIVFNSGIMAFVTVFLIVFATACSAMLFNISLTRAIAKEYTRAIAISFTYAFGTIIFLFAIELMVKGYINQLTGSLWR